VLEHDVDLDRGVSTAVEDLAANNVDNRGHGRFPAGVRCFYRKAKRTETPGPMQRGTNGPLRGHGRKTGDVVVDDPSNAKHPVCTAGDLGSMRYAHPRHLQAPEVLVDLPFLFDVEMSGAFVQK